MHSQSETKVTKRKCCTSVARLYTLQGQEQTIQLRNFAYLFPIMKGFTLFIVIVTLYVKRKMMHVINSSPKLDNLHTEKAIQLRIF